MRLNSASAAARLSALRPLGLPLVILAIWFIISESGSVPTYVLPSPQLVARTFADFVVGGLSQQPYSGALWSNFVASFQRVLGGFLVGSGLGIPLGIVLGYSQRAAAYIEPTIQWSRSIPGICWLPLALIWFGIGSATSIFLISLGAFYAVFISALQGVKYIEPSLLRAGRCLGASEQALLRTVILPAAFPSILSGLRIGLSYSWIYMVLGEFTGVNLGLGATLLQSRETLNTELIIVLMIVIGALGVITDRLMLLLMRRAFHMDVR